MEEKIIQLVKGKAEGFEIISDEWLTTRCEFRGDEPYSQETKMTRGFGLRVIKDGRIGFAATTDMNKISELTEAALAISRYGEFALFSLPKSLPKTKCQILNDKVAKLGSEEIFSLGKEIIRCAKQGFPNFKIDLNLDHTYQKRRIVNSAGLDCAYEKLTYSLTFAGLIVKEDGLIWIYDYKNLSDGKPFSIIEFVNRQIALAKDSLKAAKVATKAYPLIFAPSFGLNEFFLPLLQGVNGKNLQKRTTPLFEMEGKEIGSHCLSVYDDGLLDYAIGSALFDGEGVPKQVTPLIEKGVFKNFLFDLQTAGACGWESTGNASRSYNSQPQPSFNNLLVLPQNGDLNKAIGEIKEGILVYEVIGGGQSNVLAGDFSVSIGLGFKIEGGEVKGRIKDCMIAGNFYEMIKRISQIGGELKDMGNFHLPFIKFEDIKVSAK